MAENTKPIVLIVTGPCASGKTTVTKLIAKKLKFMRISGDEIKNELFPSIEQITDYPEELKKVKDEILQRAKKYFEKGENVVIDYVILGKEYIDKYKKVFSKSLQIRVLLPKREKITERDKNRNCWTAGEECATELYSKFDNHKDIIGVENYIDNTDETPDDTYSKYFAALCFKQP